MIDLRKIALWPVGGGSPEPPVPPVPPGPDYPDATGDVRFIDYDGTLLYSYSKEDFLELEELPAAKVQPGFAFLGWNWPLADAKAVVSDVGKLTIGQLCGPSDGKTKLHIFAVAYTSYNLNIAQEVDGAVTIDWGDGSTVETVSGTGPVQMSHGYAADGRYVITIDVSEGTCRLGYSRIFGEYDMHILRGAVFADNCILNQSAFDGANYLEFVANPHYYYCDAVFNYCYALKALVLNSQGLYGFSLNNCASLKEVAIPAKASYSFRSNAFSSCHALKTPIVLPARVGIEGGFNCAYCESLEEFYIQGNNDYLIAIRMYMFYSSSIRKITLPANVYQIEDYAFYGCYCLQEITLLNDTPPTLLSDAIPQYIERIYVPAAAVDTYKAATNWSAFADRILPIPVNE